MAGVRMPASHERGGNVSVLLSRGKTPIKRHAAEGPALEGALALRPPEREEERFSSRIPPCEHPG